MRPFVVFSVVPIGAPDSSRRFLYAKCSLLNYFFYSARHILHVLLPHATCRQNNISAAA